jgi:hypothetical protein
MSKKMRNNSLLIIGIFIFFLIIIIGSLFVRTTGFADNIFQSKEDSKLSDSKTTEDLVKLDSNPEEIKVQEAPEIDSEKVEGEPEPAEKAVEQDQPKIDKKELAKQKQLLELSSKDNIAIEYNYERPVISKDSGNKDIIIISKLSNLNIPGEPEIPFEVAMIMLPADKDIDKVTVIPDEKIEIKGNYDIKKGDWQFPLSEFDNPDEISKQVEELEKNKTIFKKYPVNYYSNPSLQVKKGY